ncbi:MAG: nickel-responsive transcriptional regulator NikR [candidate division WOR-3 bacterium]
MKKRFGVSIDDSILKEINIFLKKGGYRSRSHLIEELLTGWIRERKWEKGKGEVYGILIMVYEHEKREISKKLLEKGHKHYDEIISTLHIHIDERNCLEISVLRGKPFRIRKISDEIISTKGVKYGKLLKV